MSGLLQALGAQAMNVAPAVRPAARRHVPVPPGEETFETNLGLESFDEVAFQERMPTVSRESLASMRIEPTSASSAVRTDGFGTASATPAEPASAQAPAQHDDAMPRVLREEVAADTARTTARPLRESTLRPRVETAPIATPRRATASVNAPIPMPPPPPPDIHIHIGRIEVTALAPPPVPKRERPTPTTKSPSLEDYLRKGAKSP